MCYGLNTKQISCKEQAESLKFIRFIFLDNKLEHVEQLQIVIGGMWWN